MHQYNVCVGGIIIIMEVNLQMGEIPGETPTPSFQCL